MFQVSSRSLGLYLIGYNWFTCFKQCHPEISGIWTRQIATFWFKAATQEVIKPWFDAVAEICSEYCYPPEHRYNMDESGYAVGASQSSRNQAGKSSKVNRNE